jgi:hypothetical protein
MMGKDSTGAPLVHFPGWVGGWMEAKVVLRIAYSNQKLKINLRHELCLLILGPTILINIVLIVL